MDRGLELAMSAEAAYPSEEDRDTWTRNSSLLGTRSNIIALGDSDTWTEWLRK